MFDDWHLGFFRDARDEALAAARHDHIHILLHGDEFAHCGAVGGVHHLHGRLRQSRFAQPLMHTGGDGLVGMYGFRTAAQDGGIA